MARHRWRGAGRRRAARSWSGVGGEWLSVERSGRERDGEVEGITWLEFGGGWRE